MRKILCVLIAVAAPALAEEPLAALAKPGQENALDRLAAIRRLARTQDPLVARALVAAYARLDADPAAGFTEPEKVALLQALVSFREPLAGPCACRALADASRPVRRAGLQVLWEIRHAQAAPALVGLMASAGSDKIRIHEDLSLAERASQLLEILANRSNHFEALSSEPERQIAVTRWRQWWEANRDHPRAAWQQQGFQDEKIPVGVPRNPGEPLKAEDASALVEALAQARPVWIRENAQELLSAMPCPGPGAKAAGAMGESLAQSPCAALARGLDHADEGVRKGAASALLRVLSRGGHPKLPEPSADLPSQLKTWWSANVSA